MGKTILFFVRTGLYLCVICPLTNKFDFNLFDYFLTIILAVGFHTLGYTQREWKEMVDNE